MIAIVLAASGAYDYRSPLASDPARQMTFGRSHAFCRQRYRRKIKMKTSELIEHVASEAGVEKSAAKKAVDAVFGGIVDAAKKGEEANFPGFGKFKIKNSPARQGRNPATGATIEIAASKKLGFSPAKQVKDALAG
jgi:DNA-binding protein HU-beta